MCRHTIIVKPREADSCFTAVCRNYDNDLAASLGPWLPVPMQVAYSELASLIDASNPVTACRHHPFIGILKGLLINLFAYHIAPRAKR